MFEEFGHRVEAQPKRDRHKDQGDNDDGNGGEQRPSRDRQADAAERLAVHSDQLFGRKARRDQRNSNHPPTEVAAGEEIVLVIVLFAGGIDRNADNRRNKQHEHDGIDQSNIHDRGGLRLAARFINRGCISRGNPSGFLPGRQTGWGNFTADTNIANEGPPVR